MYVQATAQLLGRINLTLEVGKNQLKMRGCEARSITFCLNESSKGKVDETAEEVLALLGMGRWFDRVRKIHKKPKNMILPHKLCLFRLPGYSNRSLFLSGLSSFFTLIAPFISYKIVRIIESSIQKTFLPDT